MPPTRHIFAILVTFARAAKGAVDAYEKKHKAKVHAPARHEVGDVAATQYGEATVLAVRADGTHVCRIAISADATMRENGASCRAFLRPDALADVGDCVVTPWGRGRILERPPRGGRMLVVELPWAVAHVSVGDVRPVTDRAP